MKIPAIKNLIQQSRYEEAFAACAELLATSPAQKDEILRARAYGYARSGEYAKAASDYETIILGSKPELRDFFLAAYHSLYPQQFLKAEKWFLEVLRLGEEQENDWFVSATRFYLSYIQMQKGEYGEALRYLEEATIDDSHTSLPLPEVGACSPESLRGEIERRANL